MTRKEAIELIDKVTSKHLFSAIIFFKSCMTGKIEERHIYADDYSECTNWADDRYNVCVRNGLACVTYLNGGINRQYLDISDYFDENEDE